MNVLITGATGGIGKALIEIFTKNNYHIIAVGRNKKELNALQHQYGHQILSYQLDLSNDEEIDNFFNFLDSREIKINILINGAGIGEINSFENISYLKLKKILNINTLALTKFTSHFYQKMVSKGGTIINISSTGGFQKGGPLISVYYATKSYVNSLTYALHYEGKKKNVRVMLLAPGPTKTNFIGMQGQLSPLEKLYVTTPEEVALSLYKGFKKNKFLIIPGILNKLLYYFDKILPSKLSIALIEQIQRKKLIKMRWGK